MCLDVIAQGLVVTAGKVVLRPNQSLEPIY